MTTRMRLRRSDGQVYLERWGFENDRFGVFLHRMNAADPGIDLHDHPWHFASLILWGGYDEERNLSGMAVGRAQWAARRRVMIGGHQHVKSGALTTRRWFSWRRTYRSECHRIVSLNANPTWTLVFHGPRRGSWGFFTPEGFVDHSDYDAARRDLTTETS